MAISGWALVVILQVLVLIAIVPLLLMAWMLSARDKAPIRDSLFESGQVPVGEGRRRLVMQYYPYLIMFVVFDVLAMFLFAWGIAYAGIGLEGSVFVLIFLAVLVPPLIYALRLSGKKELW